MAKRAVVWTETAVRQRRDILKYWTLRNKSTAFSEKLIKLIRRKVNIIEKHPASFKETEFADTRESALGHFSIYYKATATQIIITAFWDNRQDPEKLLKLLRSYDK